LTVAYFITSTSTIPVRMPITHVLLASFKADAKPEAVDKVCKQFVALKETCLHPDTKKPYILSARGGKNNSPEDNHKGMTHGFVMEFKDETDRDYFLNTDPSHKAFVEAIIPQNSDFLVLDFTEGAF
jgi:hypothetical protein